jgi:hypothetical protein
VVCVESGFPEDALRIRSFVFLSSSLLLSGSLLAQSSSSPYVFSEAQFSTGPTPYSVAAGDFNRDGKLDLAVANADSTNGNSVSVLLGNSDGTFQPKDDYLFGAAPYAVITGDVNSDGKLDLLLAEPNANSVSVLLGNGDGTFQSPLDFTVGQGPRALVISDFNRDGKMDLGVGNQTDNTISVLLGKGDGTFQPQFTAGLAAISPRFNRKCRF